jgi:gamma-glutamyltranspeptidase/glutathione hydrolase
MASSVPFEHDRALRAGVPAVPVFGLGGMVATPHHHATEGGRQALRAGGTVIDAAIAANAVLGVVYPDMCGIGGDLCAVVWDAAAHRPHVLNGTGPAGSGRSRDELSRRHPEGLPLYGPDTVTVPGTPRSWESLHERYGRLRFSALFADAIELARAGFACPQRLSASIATFRPPVPDLYGPDGNPIPTGRRVRLPAYAETLREFAAGGTSALAEGKLAEELASVSHGAITPADLSEAAPRWATPLMKRAFGTDIWAPPPNSQAYLIPLAAAILERAAPPADPDDPRQWHLMVESIKAAAHDRDQVLGDPGEEIPTAFDDVRGRA